jgi:hypothetical protein
MYTFYQLIKTRGINMKPVKTLIVTAALIYSQLSTAGTFSLGMCTTDPMIITLNDSMLTLGKDIGEMADRILTTETYIGDMANRIVETETLMSTTLLQLQANATAGNASTASRPGVLLLSPGTGSTVYRHSTPTITLSNSATSYVLYVSTSGNFQDGSMLPLLITPEAPLDTVWENAVQSLSGNTIYIAVKSVYGEYNLSELSNGVRLQLQ